MMCLRFSFFWWDQHLPKAVCIEGGLSVDLSKVVGNGGITPLVAWQAGVLRLKPLFQIILVYLF